MQPKFLPARSTVRLSASWAVLPVPGLSVPGLSTEPRTERAVLPLDLQTAQGTGFTVPNPIPLHRPAFCVVDGVACPRSIGNASRYRSTQPPTELRPLYDRYRSPVKSRDPEATNSISEAGFLVVLQALSASGHLRLSQTPGTGSTVSRRCAPGLPGATARLLQRLCPDAPGLRRCRL